jgi:prolyl oligopeptidase
MSAPVDLRVAFAFKSWKLPRLFRGRLGMKKLAALIWGAVAFGPAAAASLPGQPAVPPAKPVTETLFGTKITDRYRYFEAEGTAVVRWMKAEGRFTRATLDAQPGHAEILKRLSALTGSFDVIASVALSSGKTFFEQRAPGSDNYDLMVREPDGRVRKLVDVAAIRAAHGGEPFAINYFAASNDGTKVAVGISQGGSENASLYVYDTATGAQIAGPVPNAQTGAVSWAPDDRTLFTNLLNPLKPSDSETKKYQYSKTYVWDLKSAPVPVLGAGVSPAIQFAADEFPIIQTAPDLPLAYAVSLNGVQNEWAVWTTPVAAAARADAPWVKLISREDDITNATSGGNRMFFLSHHGAPTFQILAVTAGEPLSAAKVIVPARPDRVIESMVAAADGLYVRARHGVYSELFKVPLDGGAEQPISLPFKGSVDELAADPRYPGAVVIIDSWAVPRQALVYDPRANRFADLGLGHPPQGFDPALYETADLKAKAADGTEVPLSLARPKGEIRPLPLLLVAYGSYGLSQFPGFGTRSMAFLPNGIQLATCHVRGGGELGESWRLGGKDATKPNTWRDLIACSEELIARGYTDKAHLFIFGGSAGGITMGRAMEERPDLFAGVLDLVPSANPLRAEFSVSGPANIPEFGTIKNESGFKNLLAMDSLAHVKRGVKYPPIMITTGLNDPRVSSWEPAKFAATLRAAGPTVPVLLRVDEKAGHGIGSTKTQNDELYADVVSFILWQSGDKTAAPARGERGD